MEKKKDIITYHPTLLDRKIKNLRIDYEMCQNLFTFTTFLMCNDLINYATLPSSMHYFISVLSTGVLLGMEYDVMGCVNNDIRMLVKRKYGE